MLGLVSLRLARLRRDRGLTSTDSGRRSILFRPFRSDHSWFVLHHAISIPALEVSDMSVELVDTRIAALASAWVAISATRLLLTSDSPTATFALWFVPFPFPTCSDRPDVGE